MWSLIPLAVVLVALPAPGGAPTGCTNTWTGAVGSNAWFAPGNWSSGRAPVAGDRACVPGDGTVDLRGRAAEVRSLDVQGALRITHGSLQIDDSASLSSIARLTIDSAALAGRGTIRVTQSLRLDSALLTGSGLTVLAASASGRMTSGWLDHTTLRNDGRLTFASAWVLGTNGALLDNRGQLTVVRGGLIQGDGSPASICNRDRFIGEGGVNTIEFRIDNNAAVIARSGDLIFLGGGASSDLPGSSCPRSRSLLSRTG